MAPPPSTTSTVVAGRYQLGELLGRGGMAEVREGTDLRLQRPVAVKFLLPAMAARDDIRRRFEAEACAAASLSDPHAVAVFDTGEHQGQPYIVMERLPGETLADRIARGPVDPGWLRQIAVEVLGALAAAHAAGLVHRDVKPGNILLTTDDHAKIADFGIAKSLEASGPELALTGTGQLLGTPAYLAPERLDGAPATPKADIYALGVVMYEALAGKCPFPDTTALGSARAIVAGEYTPLDDVRPGLDPTLVAAIRTAMATDPADRFESASAMAAAVSTTGDAPTVVSAAAPLDATSVMAMPALHPTEDVDAPLMAAGARRNRLPLALLLGLVFVALLVAFLNRSDPATPRPSATTPSTTALARGGAPAATTPTTAASANATEPAVTAPPTTAPSAVITDGGKGRGKDAGKGKGKDG